MSELTIDLRSIRTERRSLESVRAAVMTNDVRLVEAESELNAAVAGGLSEERLRTLREDVEALRARRDELRDAERSHIGRLRDLSDIIVGARDPGMFVETLDGGVPIALLPVRIETRFFANDTALRIRIYPDQLHIDGHEPELTADEIAGGRWYWEQRWTDPAGTAAWQELATRFGAARAAWIVRTMTPSNAIGDPAGPSFPNVATKAAAWTRAPTAVVLPDRWVAVGLSDDGAEMFRVWGKPVPDALAVTPAPDPTANPDEIDVAPADELPIDDTFRWVVDYDAADAAGMAITVTNDDLNAGHRLANGIRRLIVLGVDWTLTPQEAAGDLHGLLDAHRYTDTFAFITPGTPTNNTGAERAGLDRDRASQAAAIDPALPDPLPDGHAAGQLMSLALGFPADAQTLLRAPNATMQEQRTAALLIDALWEGTLGYYLDQLMDPVLDDDDIGLTREHAVANLRPGGPLPAMRVGRQPYGVLPVVAPARWKPTRASGFEATLHEILTRLRPIWEQAVLSAPRMGRTDDPDTDLLEILQQGALAQTARFRRVFGPSFLHNSRGMQQHAAAQEIANGMVAWMLGMRTMPKLASYTTDPRDHPLPVPWVQATITPGVPVDPNYIAAIAQMTRRDGGRTELRWASDADTLLHALLANAAVHELDKAASIIVHLHQLAIGAINALPVRVAFRTPELIRVQTSQRVDPEARAVEVHSPGELHALVLPATTETRTVGAYLADRITEMVWEEEPAFRGIGDFLAALDALATRPADELDRAFRGILDCFSYRLDAWFTSFATRRLNEIRAGSPNGTHVGGFGWVEHLRPDRQPDSLGYIHMPSLAHASTAAILRSGHLAHRDAEHDALDIDLRSERVRLALSLLDGVAQGQPLAALLGYRFERAIRERDIRLARFILPIRNLAPLRPSGEGTPAQPVEAVAARDVVDGVGLLDRWRREGSALLQPLNAGGDQQALEEELGKLAELSDAVADVLVAEAVYQTVLGNTERAGAALAVLDRQERPVTPDVVRTPRSVIGYAQRVLVLIGDDAAAGAWQDNNDFRSAAEPRLNAWIASLLGDPDRFRIAGTLTTSEGEETDLETSVIDLDLSPISLVLLSRADGRERPSALEEWIALTLVAGRPAGSVTDAVVISDEPPSGSPPDVVGFAALKALLDWIHGLVASARAADARDLALPEHRDPQIDSDELRQRADDAVAAVDAALADLNAVISAASPSDAALVESLERAVTLDAKIPFPRVLLPEDVRNEILRAQAEAAHQALDAMRTRVAALEADFAEKAATTPPTNLTVGEHHVSRIKTIFGEDFPVLPQFRASDPVQLTASLDDAHALTDGDDLVAIGWLQQVAAARPATDRLVSVLDAAELLGTSRADATVVGQLPHVPGQRWAALPFGKTPPSAQLAFAAHTHGTIDPTKLLAGLVCDEWTEQIPNASEITGLSFHYDAPAARAPQTILLAVPPERRLKRWSLNILLDTVIEAAELASIRVVGPQHLQLLGGMLPTVYLPQNFSRDVPSVNLFDLFKKYPVSESIARVLGKG